MKNSAQIALIASVLRLGKATPNEQKEVAKKLQQISRMIAIDEKAIDAIIESAIEDFEAKCLSEMPPQFHQAAA